MTSAPTPRPTPPTTASSGTPLRRCCCGCSSPRARRYTCSTPRPRVSSSRLRAAKERRVRTFRRRSIPGPYSWATSGPTSSAGARTPCPTTCPRRTPSRCGRPSATAPSTSSPPTTRPIRARRRSPAGPTAGRHIPARPRPSSTCPCCSTRCTRAHLARACRRVPPRHAPARVFGPGSRRAASRSVRMLTSPSSTSSASGPSPTPTSSPSIDWTPYADRRVRGAIDRTLVRGTGSSTRTARVIGVPGWGRQVVPPTSRPAP